MSSDEQHDITRPGHLFVTGTDTDVGKTFVTCAIARMWQAVGAEVCAVKPVAAGGGPDQNGIFRSEDSDALDDASTVVGRELLAEIAGASRSPLVGMTRAMAPLTASESEGTPVEYDGLLKQIQRIYSECQRRGVFLILEGAGGVLVPLTHKKLVIDLIADCELPALVVARSELGTINHTLLTLEALARRNVYTSVLINRVRSGELTAIERAGISEIRAFANAETPLWIGETQSGVYTITRVPLP